MNKICPADEKPCGVLGTDCGDCSYPAEFIGFDPDQQYDSMQPSDFEMNEQEREEELYHIQRSLELKEE